MPRRDSADPSRCGVTASNLEVGIFDALALGCVAALPLLSNLRIVTGLRSTWRRWPQLFAKSARPPP